MIRPQAILLFLFLSAGEANADALGKIRELGVRFETVNVRNACELALTDATYGVRAIKSAPPFRMLRTERSLRDTLHLIVRDHGRVVIDCAMFAQVAALAVSNQADRPATLLDYGHVDGELAAMIHQADYAYVQLQGKHSNSVGRSPFVSKGQWLVKVGPDHYLGLSRKDGPVVTSAAQWRTRAKTALTEEVDDVLANNPYSPAGRHAALLSCELAQGRLDDWTLEHFTPTEP